MSKKPIVIIIIVAIILVLIGLAFDWGRREAIAPSDIGISTSTDDLPIVVSYPKDNQEVKSPLKISGKARGIWFFEGSFPIDLVDSNGEIIASSIATSSEGWMTEDFIDFSSTIVFEKPTSTTRALLVLKKDNPSDNPDLDQSIFIPLILK